MLTTFIILLEANDACTHQRERVHFCIRLNVYFITIQAIKAKPFTQFGIPENLRFNFNEHNVQNLYTHMPVSCLMITITMSELMFESWNINFRCFEVTFQLYLSLSHVSYFIFKRNITDKHNQFNNDD